MLQVGHTNYNTLQPMSTEAKIQQEIFMWYNNTYCLSHHSPRNLILSIPNEGKPELIRTGLYPGASDLFIIHHPLPPMFVEIKTPDGRQSDKQRAFQAHVASLGYAYYLIRSLEAFKSLITSLS